MIQSNKRKSAFIEGKKKETCLLSLNPDIAQRCKFNFSFFDEGLHGGQDFSDWNKAELVDLLKKITQFSGNSLEHWTRQKRFTNYKTFPRSRDTEFKCPLNIPHQAEWARFRIGGKIRLVGFVIPGEFNQKTISEMNGKARKPSEYIFCCNTLYVVFLDKEHRFWKTER